MALPPSLLNNQKVKLVITHQQLLECNLHSSDHDGSEQFLHHELFCRMTLQFLQQSGRGITPQDRLKFNEMRDQVQRDAEAKRQQIIQNFRQRGMGGSGAMNYYSMGYADFGDGGAGLEEQEQETEAPGLAGDPGAVMDVIKSKGGSALDSALKKISEPRELIDLLTNLIDLIASEDSVNDDLMKAITSKVQKYYQGKGL